MLPTTHKEDRDEDFLLEKISIIAEAIAKTFGSQCEVVLHDLRQLDRSVIKIEHGQVTGRKVGSSITDLALKNLKSQMKNDLLLNYRTTTKSGRTLKSTTALIRNKKNIPIGALCINIDITNLQQACSEISKLCQIRQDEKKISETFENDITGTISSIIDRIIRDYHKVVPAMKKEDRVEIVAKLEEQGAFLVKGAVKIVADKLNVSKYAIYNYLEDASQRFMKERPDALRKR